MAVSIRVNGTNLSLAHKMAGGLSTATIPDVCKTPSPGGPVPVPYPNIAQIITLSNGTSTVKTDKIMGANKGSKFDLSNGDNAGTLGGVKSNVFMKEATWILYSFDVKMDGKNACRLTDKMFHNQENAANLAGYIGQVVLTGESKEIAERLCAEFCKDLKKSFKKDPKTGRWKRDYNKNSPKGTRISDRLEGRLKDVQGQKPWKDWGITFQNRGIPKTPPDVLQTAGNGSKLRCFDFKFPRDRYRRGKLNPKTGRRSLSQHARQKRLTNGRKPVEISADTCSC
jgi:hypothetical protein